uniref:Uncharacterized protein n=1 Tax=Acrobeloides nanus TaxID=290746 RepID=A0A914E294_9BILA
MNAIPPPSNVSYPTQVPIQPTIYPYVVNPAQESYRPPYSAPSAPEASPITFESVPAFVYNQPRPMEPPPEYRP